MLLTTVRPCAFHTEQCFSLRIAEIHQFMWNQFKDRRAGKISPLAHRDSAYRAFSGVLRRVRLLFPENDFLPLEVAHDFAKFTRYKLGSPEQSNLILSEAMMLATAETSRSNNVWPSTESQNKYNEICRWKSCYNE